MTLREAVNKQAKDFVELTLRTWERAISGDLTAQHYRRLSEGVVSHLLLVQECLKALDEPQFDERASR